MPATYTKDFTRTLAVAEITAPAYACEARTTGPRVRSSNRSKAFTSSLRDVRGMGAATTLNPLACKGRMTPLQLEPSAHAPWTMTMVIATPHSGKKPRARSRFRPTGRKKIRRTRPEPRRRPTRPNGMPMTSPARSRVGEHLTGRLSCWRSVAVPVVQTALAAGLSWFVAMHLFGHYAPLFAPVAAIVSIDMTLGQRLRRAIELIVGASVGVGPGVLLISVIDTGPWQIAVVVALATSVAVLAQRPGGDQRSGSGVSNPGGDVVRAG